MAAADALSLQGGDPGYDLKRWVAGGAFALALHAAALIVLSQSPEPVGTEPQASIEMDLTPPSGAAQMSEPAPDSTPVATPEPPADAEPDAAEQTPPDEQLPPLEKPEELPELDAQPAPQPPDSETVATELPEQTVDETPRDEAETPPEEAKPVEQQTPVQQPQVATNVTALPPDVTAAPPDVEAAVTLPPETAVVAREETPEPPPPPVRKAVAKKEPKPEPKREAPKETRPREAARTNAPKTDAPPAEKPKAPPAARPAGAAGSSASSAAAASAASGQYGATISRILAAQKRYPQEAQAQKLAGRGVITFTVNRGGRVVSQSFSPTGSPVLDQALRQMLQRAAGSFPPMPTEMPGASKTFSVPVSFSFRG